MAVIRGSWLRYEYRDSGKIRINLRKVTGYVQDDPQYNPDELIIYTVDGKEFEVRIPVDDLDTAMDRLDPWA